MESIAIRLASIRATAGLSTRAFADWVRGVGHEVQHTTVGNYEKGTTVSADYLAAVAIAFSVSPLWILNGEGPRENQSPDKDATQLEAIRRILSGELLPAEKASNPTHVSDEVLRERFLSAIFDYSDSRVNEISGLSIETVRQYRDESWPNRGFNKKTRLRMIRLIDHHQTRVTAVRWADGESPPMIAGAMRFVRRFEQNEEFQTKYPNQGAISLADSVLAELRGMGVLTQEDEAVWVGFKQGRDYDPATADQVTAADLGMKVNPGLLAGDATGGMSAGE